MKWRYLAWAVVLLAVMGFAAVMIPGSPLSLQNTIGDPVAVDYPEGHVPEPGDEKKYPTRPLRAWTADLASPDVAVRRKALDAIGTIAPLASRSAGPVAKVLGEDPDPALREKASQILYRMGAGAKPVLPQVTAALTSDNPAIRRNAALYMMSLKADAQPAVPALVAAMNDPRNEDMVGYPESIQVVAASAIGGASAGSGEAVPALIAVVESSRPDLLRAAAVRSLGVIGAAAKPAVPALYNALKSSDWELKEVATDTLRILGETVPDVNRPGTNVADYAKGMAGGGSNQKSMPKAGGDPDGKKGRPAPKKGGPSKDG